MTKDNEERKLKLRPHTAKNVIDAQNRKIKRLNTKSSKIISDIWKTTPKEDR